MQAIKRKDILPVALLAAVVALVSLGLYFFAAPLSSVELGIATHSPNGERGGAVVPASCPSYAHYTGECDTPIVISGCTPGPQQVATYQHINYEGTCQTWPQGYFNFDSFTNDDISSIQVGSEVEIVTCTEPNFTGPGQFFIGDANDLRNQPIGNDTISSFRIQPRGGVRLDAGNNCSVGSCSLTGGGQPSSITINSGASVQISWNCTAPSTASSGFNFSTGGALTGSVSVTPTQSTSYSLYCNAGCWAQTLNVTVNNPTVSISASPTRVRSGATSMITWSATQVSSCAVTGPGFSATGLSGSQATSPLIAQATYTVTCQSAGGPKSASVTVTINPNTTEI